LSTRIKTKKNQDYKELSQRFRKCPELLKDLTTLKQN
jgi:hypothetical protein